MAERKSPRTFDENLTRCRLHLSTLAESLDAVAAHEHNKLSELQVILYCLVRRTVELSRAAIRNFEEKAWASGILCARAAGESVALAIYVCQKWAAKDGGPESREEQRKLFKRVLAGAKITDGMANPIHVMDAVRAAEARVQNFELLYNQLSEFAHPNAIGLYSSLTVADQARFPKFVGMVDKCQGLAQSVAGPFLRICLAQACQYLITNDMFAPMIKLSEMEEKWRREFGRTTS